MMKFGEKNYITLIAYNMRYKITNPANFAGSVVML